MEGIDLKNEAHNIDYFIKDKGDCEIYMNKKYFSLGLMSGTSGDGVDASIIESDGIDQIKGLSNNSFRLLI